MTTFVGLDIGGANLKATHPDGTAHIVPFPLWKQPAQLPSAIAALLDKMPTHDRLAVTMTGELCDCFETKRQGVLAILDAVEQSAHGKDLMIWRNDATFASLKEARQTPLAVAAANWLALATYAGRFASSGPVLLVDVGSTTTDIIPLQDGKPVPRGRNDVERLKCQELVYTGVKRTPVCALLSSAVMAELFATTLDVYLVLDDIADSDDNDTADGRPATKSHAMSRLARMLGGDSENCTEEEILSLARKTAAIQQAILRCALRRVQRSLSGPAKHVILSGCGEFLAQRALLHEGFDEENLIHLSKHLGPGLSAAACAHAVAVLAQEKLQHGA